MSNTMPYWFKSKYFYVKENGGWALKNDAPYEMRKSFDEYLSDLNNGMYESYTPKTYNSKKVEYLAIGSHYDDIEFMAFDGIVKGQGDNSFMAVISTNGKNSARTGKYANVTNDEMAIIRQKEQMKAAEIGKYNQAIMLNLNSEDVKNPESCVYLAYADIIRAIKPKILYTHNIFDKHPTHVSVAKNVIKAVLSLEPKDRPEHVYGCEVWRDLDWLPSKYKVEFNVSNNEKLAKDLLSVFKSQIEGGKDYYNAVLGRRYANATFAESHAIDSASNLIYGVDYKDIVTEKITVEEFAKNVLKDFEKDIMKNFE